ncbi:hypothetical protein SARC_03589 [Sphaeroforma arctica JP610]|uniref:ubiquitinyl hydrolase 1 n=1 Tax=Sphaeroforma arctica JP610 TaxID=667725 RepID=A0A0L0G592_9EUKA|nr:hypothetical protein SARC_03589 [Sphaeroforma arctica JP610]KNC84200.1 hypothetical protein SARC_03589 [Sphaeroforma arctica JP610]|eukprot:XP_014158102.1 hypothetical protein SARC_03589 [Sphaeroforma arctica JP610]
MFNLLTHTFDSPVDGPRDAKRSATLSAALDGYLGSVRVPSRSDKVYKDECIFCFDNAESSEGLFVCLHAWRAMCRKHAELNSARTGHQLYMRIHTTKTLKEEEPPTDTPSTTVVVPTVIGPRYDYNTTTTIVTIPQGTELCSGDDPDMHTLVRRTVQAILESDSAARVEESMAWQEMRQECEHARNLQQIDNNVTIPSSGHHKCIKCDKDDNLWLNLQDGTILCGRMNFDGTGGNGHALEYYTETNKPLAVKMGTISADGGDVFCYVCDDMVLNPHLGLQLQHFGINMVNMEKKTEKTMAELELEQNMKHEWSMVTESGHDLVPLYGPGYTGMRNLGNSCYLASTMQLLFSIPEYASTFTPTKEAVFDYGSHVSDPVNDLNVQLNKLSYGLLSGAYSKPLPPTSEDTNGIRPSSFKTVVGRGHPEFSNSRQQDALEFFQYLLTISEKQTRATGSKNTDKDVPLEHLFRYQVEERLQCGATGKVRYSTTTDNILSLTLPLDQATNKEAVNIYLAKIQEGIAANTPYTEETLPSVRPSIPVEACLSAYLAPNEMANWISPATQTATTAIVSQRMLTFPPYLMVHTRRFYVGDDWTPQKLDVEVEMPEFLDLSTLRGCGGMQDGESSLPESKGTEPPAVVLDESVMSELASAGFGVNACKRAAFNTMGQGAVAAMEWVCGHLDDADLNDPFTLPGATGTLGIDL